jgi:hypothetical protein
MNDKGGTEMCRFCFLPFLLLVHTYSVGPNGVTAACAFRHS